MKRNNDNPVPGTCGQQELQTPMPLPDPLTMPANNPIPGPSGVQLVSLLMAAMLLTLALLVLLHRPNITAYPPDTINWQYDLPTAMVLSRASNRPMLLNFTADWCQPCQLMREQIFPDPRVNQSIRAGFIPVRVDVSHRDSPGQELAVRYQVDAIPSLVVIDGNQQIISRHDGLIWSDELVNWLRLARQTAHPR